MLSSGTHVAVEELIRTVASEEALTRFGRLSDAEISEKTGPLDLVTVADRKVEERLTAALTSLIPGSLVIGEEAVAADPGLVDALHGDAPVWIIDPIDGTSNFVRQQPEFATLVSLARHGELLASWTHLPVPGLMAVARRGEGALLNGEPVRLPVAPGNDDVLQLASARPVYLTPEQNQRFYELGPAHGVKACASGSAGCDYLDVARGELDAATYAWDNPWDHSAGILLVAEAGGAVLNLHGEPFRMADGALPFAAARDEATARRIAGLLTAPLPSAGAPG
ncbi:inositol monophosphatase family protein [Streptomyces sp. 8N706]|uniref:inositol monophosphatase family protein n=1 Tax=Streptomyces sp. 8N706 TaxID=3457416 RepID=UPI003FD596BF